MDHYSSPGGTWTMIPTPNPNSQSQSQSQPNIDPNLYLQPQHQFLHQQQQSPFQQQQSPFQQPQSPFQQQPLQPHQLYQQQQQRIQQQQQLQQQQQQSQQQNLHQSLASLLPLVENLAEVVEHGNPDQQSDALITELSNHFEKCQKLLNSISGSISTKAMTVEGQKKKLEESEKLLNQRRDLIADYRKTVEELVGSEP